MDPPSPSSSFFVISRPLRKGSQRAIKPNNDSGGEAMAEGFVFLHLFKSYVSRWRFKVGMSAKQRNTVHSDKNSILWTLGFQIHSYIHCVLRLNRTSQSTPCIPVTKNGNVRCALTPVQTHRRSLTTHRNSSPRMPIWPRLHFPFIFTKPRFSGRPGKKIIRIIKC